MAPRFLYHPTCLRESTTCVGESTFLVKQSTTCVHESTTLGGQLSTCVGESTTLVDQSTTCACESTFLVKQSSTCARESSTSVAESTILGAQSSTFVGESTTLVTQSTTLHGNRRDPGSNPHPLPIGEFGFGTPARNSFRSTATPLRRRVSTCADVRSCIGGTLPMECRMRARCPHSPIQRSEDSDIPRTWRLRCSSTSQQHRSSVSLSLRIRHSGAIAGRR